MSDHAVAIRPSLEVIDTSASLLQVIARAAADPSIDVDKMSRLLDMQERVMAKRAEMEFIAAMAKFKANPPQIVKDRRVTYGVTSYAHATLGGVCNAIVQALSRVGISHHWEPNQTDRTITVTCVLTHEGGHSSRTSISAIADDSGKKNPIQAIGSAITYLERYTLLAACGLAPDDDDDGASSGRVTQQQPQRSHQQTEQGHGEHVLELGGHAAAIADAKSLNELSAAWVAIPPGPMRQALVAAKDKRKDELTSTQPMEGEKRPDPTTPTTTTATTPTGKRIHVTIAEELVREAEAQGIIWPVMRTKLPAWFKEKGFEFAGRLQFATELPAGSEKLVREWITANKKGGAK